MLRIRSTLFRRTCVVAAVAAGVMLAGCNRDNASSNAPVAVAQLDSAAKARAAEQISQPAWLRERLPEHTVAYMRLPTLWGLMSAPSGRQLDIALASEAHTKAIAALRTAASKDPLLVEAGIAPFTALLLDDLAGPVEVAVVDTSDIANPASNFLVSLPFRIADVATLNARLAALGVPVLKAPLDANGKGELATKGYVQFDPATKRLHVLSGMAASAFALDGLVKQLGEKRAHAMHEVEKTFDTSGQGLFFWMSLKGVTGMAAAQLPQAKPGTVLRDLLDKSQAVAFGWGTVGGRGKFQLQFIAPQTRVFGYLAQDGYKTDLKTAGKPSWAMTMRLPSRQQFDTFVTNLDADFGPGTKEGYDKANEAAKTTLGFEIKDIMGLLGPELVTFEDAAGTYSAVRTPDRAALYARLDDLVTRFKWKHETLKSGQAAMHHVYVPGVDMGKALADDKDGGGDKKTAAWLNMYSRMGTHLYWTEEGDWLVFGQVPQALADRAAAKLDTDLGGWLRDNQSYDAAGTWLGIAGNTRNANQKIYYAYIAALQSVSDLLGQPTNLAELPNAASLGLPVDGAIGLSIDLTPNRAGFSVTYEQSPAEALLAAGGGIMAIAVAGVVAAIAVPAYQEYTVRAQVAGTIADAEPLKAAIAAYYAKRKKLPATDEDLDAPEYGESLKYLDHYYTEDGTIVLSFGDQANAAVHGQTLTLSPYKLGGELVWRCGDGEIAADAEPISASEQTTTVTAKYLPAYCR
ncbi:MAG TPA: pilin [Tahibacter sp.]|nr:pilin [Tahibacter sp.]